VRVEISPTEVLGAAADAERLQSALGRRTRVVGWYTSISLVGHYDGVCDSPRPTPTLTR
jgi:hypothetical protein